ncbi:MAG: bifunctional 5,10-methylenetetrahydrofolate dehydrogenase/5,10-methenyltetrahydrofolate cyclohydrolase [Candidatus Omnitrophota bacterium]
MAELLEGKILANKIKKNLQEEIKTLGTTPILASIQVGENASSEIYSRQQKRIADELGVKYCLFRMDGKVQENELIELIESLNKDKTIQGIIIQMPLPAHIDRQKIIEKLNVWKDIEGIHPENLGYISLGRPRFIPCTAEAVFELVKSTGVNLHGKETVIVGHSEIVGKPLSLLFMNEFSTVTVCHIGTFEAGHLEEHIQRAEVLVVAVGKANLVKGEWIKEGAVVIDVGINKVGEKIVGDVEFEEAKAKASWITPVPGGVGPLTVIMLMRNLVKAAKLQFSR